MSEYTILSKQMKKKIPLHLLDSIMYSLRNTTGTTNLCTNNLGGGKKAGVKFQRSSLSLSHFCERETLTSNHFPAVDHETDHVLFILHKWQITAKCSPGINQWAFITGAPVGLWLLSECLQIILIRCLPETYITGLCWPQA